MKKRATLLITICITLLLSMTAFAKTGNWIQAADGRWWFQCSDGSYPHSGWEVIDNVYYYFDSNGWMLADTITPDGYYVNASGAWVQGAVPSGSGLSQAVFEGTSVECLKGLVADDIYNEFAGSEYSGKAFFNWESDGVEDAVAYAAEVLGMWAAEKIKYLPASTSQRATNVNGHEWCFGTDIGNNTAANFPYYYSYYFALKNYYNSNGTRSTYTYNKLKSWASEYTRNTDTLIKALYDDLQVLITECNNIIRSQG